MAARIKNLSKTFVWILLAMVIAGLGGYGALNLSATVRTVATVGDEVVTTEQFARELQREIRVVEAQTGQRLQSDQIRQAGLDQMVLGRLIAIAAIDNEIAHIGLSVGDETLQKEILKIGAFQGPDGKFDRDTYKFQLEQAGLTEAEFEEDLRKEQARTLVQGAIMGGARMPAVLTDTIAAYVGERRSFTMARLTAESLGTPIPEPTEDDLRAYYEAHKDDFRLPETKKITYALLSPEMVMDVVEVDEAAIRKLYDERRDKYDIPDRRLVERLVFPDEQAARDAKAQLEVGGTTFEALVRDRGLELEDVDMGDVTAADLGNAAEQVFAAEVGDVVGPVQTDLGPALFRVNGTLAAHHTPFEEARAELREELAGEAARRVIEGRAEAINDLLAGGATLEELAKEEGLRLDHIDWTAEAAEGIAAYDAFRQAAEKATPDDYPEALFLDDGGLFALRVDEVLPPRPEPFEQARDKVADAWRLAETEKALRAEAERILADLGEDGDLAAAGLDTETESGLTRTAFVEGTPPDFMAQVFKMEPGEVRVIGSGAVLHLVRLDEILPPAEDDQMTMLKTAYAQQADQALGQALFEAYARDAQLRAQPTFDQQAAAAVLSNLR
ncbi:peptidyl-prolyl cis-trans isomerase [Jhaorihella thermophila]|uniref:Parvulin-like PPIase n=1 Tax=Jhaorihella thermophila TaxID=488547 RepID=A0A1H5RTE4_9RHOB|nr:peptidyl-prolyl cis-trans isomerase [Jhaorihella thermophila]SEF41374.1 peptidyl-prolyl cis-trans isomerase D [Jhaorihella thermophila]